MKIYLYSKENQRYKIYLKFKTHKNIFFSLENSEIHVISKFNEGFIKTKFVFKRLIFRNISEYFF